MLTNLTFYDQFCWLSDSIYCWKKGHLFWGMQTFLKRVERKNLCKWDYYIDRSVSSDWLWWVASINQFRGKLGEGSYQVKRFHFLIFLRFVYLDIFTSMSTFPWIWLFICNCIQQSQSTGGSNRSFTTTPLPNQNVNVHTDNESVIP